MLRVALMDKPQETLESIVSPESDPRHANNSIIWQMLLEKECRFRS